MANIQELIRNAQATGNLDELANAVKGAPMSPKGFTQTKQGSFGDGELDDDRWMQVEAAVMSGELSQDNYDKLYDRCYG